MKNSLLVLSILASFTLLSCSDSGTGSDPGNEEEMLTYSVSVNISPSDGGAISPAADSTYEENEEIELQANSNEGYLFTGWSGDIDSTSDNPLSLTVDQNYSIKANFKIKSYELTVNTEGEGTVSEEVLEQKSKEYDYGTVVELTANAKKGWKFVKWQGAKTASENPIELTIKNATEITAEFSKAFYLAENGVTIKCPAADVGETGTVDGVTYTKRTKEQITVSNAATTCTSGIKDMSQLFYGNSEFNENISHWDVSNVTDDMTGMFYNAQSFNQNIGDWDVSSVTSMHGMFFGATAFNQDIGDWEVSSVTDMIFMFYDAQSFNQDIGGWDVSNVTNMYSMFSVADAFNQDIGNWDVANVTNMEAMFGGASSFNQDISGWCVSNINSEPVYFSSESPLINSYKPQWGTCPD